ncbi:MAG: 6-aminohexanoate-cyclic-dimer hydrolase [Alphaproteobacteria bacterium]|nr:MAG: 6-aminohexanoate-cyclic-dimer hydrolase [Alphaproteobacteria bacterium]
MAGFVEYESYDAVGLAGLIARKEVAAAEVLEAAIARIEARNPAINAVVHRQYDSARDAVKTGLPPGPLCGVPYLLKDLYVLETGMPCSNASRLYDGFVADHDSTLTERLKRAGMVIVGRTNTPEFGINMATEPVRWGPTRNPWNRARSAGGSSGGAAAAVAARMVPAAHATDGGGSIRIPAANCGLFGLKLTRGRNPAGPDVGEGWSGLAGGHCVTVSVRDSAAILDATGGPAPGDPYCAPAPARPFREEVGADPGRLRIALMTAAPGGGAVHKDCAAAALAAGKLCEELGHHVEEAAPEIDFHSLVWAMSVIIGGNLRNGMDLRLKALGREQREGDVEAITALWAQDARRRSAADYARAILIVHTIGRRMGAFFERYDALISPTLANPPLPLGATDMMSDDLDSYNAMLFTQIPFTPPFNASGCPAASLPLHWTADGLPVGVQIGARFGDEATILRLAAQIEAARPWRGRVPSGLAAVP